MTEGVGGKKRVRGFNFSTQQIACGKQNIKVRYNDLIPHAYLKTTWKRHITSLENLVYLWIWLHCAWFVHISHRLQTNHIYVFYNLFFFKKYFHASKLLNLAAESFGICFPHKTENNVLLDLFTVKYYIECYKQYTWSFIHSFIQSANHVAWNDAGTGQGLLVMLTIHGLSDYDHDMGAGSREGG